MNKYIEYAWGEESRIVDAEYCGKLVHVKPGGQCSLHYHKVKDETLYVIAGRGWVEHSLIIAGTFGPIVRCPLAPGEWITIARGKLHRFGSLEHLTMIEMSNQHSENDINMPKTGKPVDHNERIADEQQQDQREAIRGHSATA